MTLLPSRVVREPHERLRYSLSLWPDVAPRGAGGRTKGKPTPNMSDPEQTSGPSMTEGAPCGKRAPGGLAVPLEAQSSPQGRRWPPLPHSRRLPQTREGGAAPWAQRRFASPLAGHVPSAPAPRWTSVRWPHHERLLRGGGARRVFTGGKTVFPFHSCMPSLTSLPRTPRCPAMRSLSLRGAD